MEILTKYKSNEKILKGVMKALSNDAEKLKAYLPQIFLLYITELSTMSEIKAAKLVL